MTTYTSDNKKLQTHHNQQKLVEKNIVSKHAIKDQIPLGCYRLLKILIYYSLFFEPKKSIKKNILEIKKKVFPMLTKF